MLRRFAVSAQVGVIACLGIAVLYVLMGERGHALRWLWGALVLALPAASDSQV